MMHFDGATYEATLDGGRLSKQLDKVKTLMADGQWRTLSQIEKSTGHPQASVSARLRDLRKPRFGSHCVERRRVSGGLYEYRVAAPAAFEGDQAAFRWEA